MVGDLRQGQPEAEHPRALGNIRELASIHLRRGGSPVVTNRSQDAQAQQVSAALVAVIAGGALSLFVIATRTIGPATLHRVCCWSGGDAQCVPDIATLDTLRGRGMRVIEEEAEHLLRG